MKDSNLIDSNPTAQQPWYWLLRILFGFHIDCINIWFSMFCIGLCLVWVKIIPPLPNIPTILWDNSRGECVDWECAWLIVFNRSNELSTIQWGLEWLTVLYQITIVLSFRHLAPVSIIWITLEFMKVLIVLRTLHSTENKKIYLVEFLFLGLIS